MQQAMQKGRTTVVSDANTDEVRGWLTLHHVAHLLWSHEDDEEVRWRRDELLYFGARVNKIAI